MTESHLTQSVDGVEFLDDTFHGLLPADQDEISQAYLRYLGSGLPRGRAERKRVLVVGCGIAGMVTAKLLREQGHDVTIVEGSRVIGGRLRTFRNTDEKRHFESDHLTAEAGAMRIPDDHPLVQHLIDESGLPTRIFFNRSISREAATSDAILHPPRRASFDLPPQTGKNFVHVNYRHVSRGTYEASTDVEGLLGYGLGGKENRRAKDLLEDVIGPLREKIRKDPKRAWPKIIKKYGEKSMRDVLRKHGLSENAIEMIGVLENLESRMSYSFIQSLIELAIITPDTKFWMIEGGTDSLPKKLFEMWGLGDVTVFNQTVEAIYLHDDTKNVRVKTLISRDDERTAKLDRWNAEELREREWDEVVVTIPFTALRLVRIWPAFSQAKRRSMRQLHYDAATKILLEFRERFWETRLGIYGGGSVSDLPTRFTYYPSDRMGSSKGGVILASYSWADDARKWDSMSEYDRYCRALDAVAITHAQHAPGEQRYEVRKAAQDEIRKLCVFQPDDYTTDEEKENVVGAATVSWATDPQAFGEAAIFYPGQLGLLHDGIIRSEWEGKAHFAGEHASLKHAWIEGALESAVHAALLVNENELPKLAPPPPR